MFSAPPNRIPLPPEMLKKLRPQSPLFPWIEKYQRSTESATAGLLLQALEQSACNGADREAGYYLLTTLSFSPVERIHANRLLLQAFRQPQEDKITGDRIVQTGSKTLLASIGLALMLASVFHWPYVANAVGFAILAGLLLPVVFGYQDQQQVNRLRRLAAKALAYIGDPDCIFALYEHVRLPSIFRPEALTALRAVLPRTTEAWYGVLPTGTGAALTSLAAGNDEEMALLALEALETAGDGGCVEAVERLASHAKSERIRAAAAVLPTLIARSRQENAAATLLRPGAPNTGAHLVRPAYDTDPNAANLLRASDAQEENGHGKSSRSAQ